jgi:hypothetical protein
MLTAAVALQRGNFATKGKVWSPCPFVKHEAAELWIRSSPVQSGEGSTASSDGYSHPHGRRTKPGKLGFARPVRKGDLPVSR